MLKRSPRGGQQPPTDPESRCLDDIARGVVVGGDPSILEFIGRDGCALAIWRRACPPEIRTALDMLSLDHVEGFRLCADTGEIPAAVAGALAHGGISEPRLHRFLAADMTCLALQFVAITRPQRVELRLSVVRTDGCRRFHTDNFPARLAVTYAGPGTIWVPPELGERALVEQSDYRGPIRELPTFWAGIFAGSAAGRAGLVHRSPRLHGLGLQRLFFCVNSAPH